MTIHGFYKLLKNYCLTYSGYQGKGNKARETTGCNISITRVLSGSTIGIDLRNVVMHMIGNLYESRHHVDEIEFLFYRDFTQFIQYLLDANIRPIMIDDGMYPDLKIVKWQRIQIQESKRTDRYEYYRRKVIQFIKYNEPDKCIWNALLYGSFEVTKISNRNQGSHEAIKGTLNIETINGSYEQIRKRPMVDAISIPYQLMKRELMNVMEKTRRVAYRSSFNYDKQKLRDLIEAYGIPYIVAPGEAEKFLAMMVESGHADMAMSEDSDLLAYLCKRVIRKCDYYSPLLNAQYFDIDMVAKGFGVDLDRFQDLCICLGTDYNDSVPDFSFRRTYDMVIKYGNPSNWKDISGRPIDISNINYSQVKSIFSIDLKDDISIGPFGQIDYHRIQQIINSVSELPPVYYPIDDMMCKGNGSSIDIEYYYDELTDKCIFINKSVRFTESE